MGWVGWLGLQVGRGQSQGTGAPLAAGAVDSRPVAPDSRRPAGRPLPDSDRQGSGLECETGADADSSSALIFRGKEVGKARPGPDRRARQQAGDRGRRPPPESAASFPAAGPTRPGPSNRRTAPACTGGLGAVATAAA